MSNSESGGLTWAQQFFLENYKQVHEHSRAIDRKRDTPCSASMYQAVHSSEFSLIMRYSAITPSGLKSNGISLEVGLPSVELSSG